MGGARTLRCQSVPLEPAGVPGVGDLRATVPWLLHNGEIQPRYSVGRECIESHQREHYYTEDILLYPGQLVQLGVPDYDTEL